MLQRVVLSENEAYASIRNEREHNSIMKIFLIYGENSCNTVFIYNIECVMIFNYIIIKKNNAPIGQSL